MKKGFTLIEILIVILIIGVLAGISLGQYQRVKDKAATRKLLVPLKAIMEAQRRFYTANNKQYAENLDDLDVNFSNFTGDCKLPFPVLSYCRSNGDVSIFYQPSTREIGVFFNEGKYQYSGLEWRTFHNYIECYDLRKNKMCEEIFRCTLTQGGGNSSDNYYSCPNL